MDGHTDRQCENSEPAPKHMQIAGVMLCFRMSSNTILIDTMYYHGNSNKMLSPLMQQPIPVFYEELRKSLDLDCLFDKHFNVCKSIQL